jgi:hypothetical protein
MAIDYRTHPKVHDNGDGTWTVAQGYDGRAWTIRTTGTHASWGEHFLGDPQGWDGDSHHFSGSFDEVAFNVVGWEI